MHLIGVGFSDSVGQNLNQLAVSAPRHIPHNEATCLESCEVRLALQDIPLDSEEGQCWEGTERRHVFCWSTGRLHCVW